MKILHVTLGNPKHHNGGLNKYCRDLMNEQEELGHIVSVLYPGVYGNKTRIRKTGKQEYSIVGALPVAITYGIDNPVRYMKNVEQRIYREWLSENKPDVIHVHSLMGIHAEFFREAEQLKIPMVFTTHDYYACCFRCNLINRQEQLCDGGFDAIRCQLCNIGGGIGKKTQILLQAEWYQIVKNWHIVKYLKKKKISINTEKKTLTDKEGKNDYNVELFENLHGYYCSIMEKMSVIHCNSEVAEGFYRKHYAGLKYEIIPISHNGIICEKHIRKDNKKLHISYFGGMHIHKGYYQLKDALGQLVKETSDEWDISLYGSEYADSFEDSRIKVKGIFTKADEESVWDETDLLVVPSQCPETFGFVVLEALARRIPVVCSDLVGSGYLLEELSEVCIYAHEDIESLIDCLMYFINSENYTATQEKIKHLQLPLSMEEHAKKMLGLYERVKLC